MGTIAAVGVAVEVGGDHAVVECRVEHRLVRFVRVAHLVTFHLLVPFIEGLLAQGVKVEVVLGEFGL